MQVETFACFIQKESQVISNFSHPMTDKQTNPYIKGDIDQHLIRRRREFFLL